MNKLKKYPWLIKDYKFLINQIYKNNYINLLLFSQKGLGGNILLLEIIKWLLCYKKNKYYSCLKCINCNLLNNNNHPDVIIFKKKKIISIIEQIRLLKNECFINSKLSVKKIFLFIGIEKYNEEILNTIISLIKLNNNNLFFLNYNDLYNNKVALLFIYCYRYIIFNPNIKDIYKWVKTLNLKLKFNNLKTIININYKLPLKIKKYLLNKNYQLIYNKYIKLINLILIKKYHTFLLYKLFNNKITTLKLFIWLGEYLLDLIKLKLNNNSINQIINYKFYKIMLLINNILSLKKIILLIKLWKNCLLNYKNNLLLNNKLFFIKFLIKCNKILLK